MKYQFRMIRPSKLLIKVWQCYDHDSFEAHNKLNGLSGKPPIKHGKTNSMYFTGYSIEYHNNVYIVRLNYGLVLTRCGTLTQAKKYILNILMR